MATPARSPTSARALAPTSPPTGTSSRPNRPRRCCGRSPHRVPALDATAERLPFDDDSFDAALASVTVHQWSDTAAGLRELRRVTRGPVVVLTFDGDALDLLQLAEYAPELIAAATRHWT
ncbi:class I SAM-dependent methyltransferase [Dactylosporangium fulvum]|uniref:Class I SAM-dependent methyltransferase n=1 Tax=Dactylosporangium fulvum TaxID=53359 RepID=A0ABY5W0X8_9ACTN|nr:class I SAM-dependent methyltransferase [Dactylosporangium fulvum]UWP82348.1 class I SAM-dependent methyltransferase [Dactylosporangium fulvum]